MTKAIPHLFADVTAKLEDLHSVAVEGQRADNTHDMQRLLVLHLRHGLVSLEGAVRAMTKALEGSPS